MSIAARVPINDVIQTVSRPILFDVLRELKNIMRISNETEIRYYGNDGFAMQAGSSIDMRDKTAITNKWPHVENLTIEVNEIPDPDQMHTAQSWRFEAPAIFADTGLGIYLWPVYMPKRVEISIKYKAADENSAQRWANDMRLRYIQGREVILHDVIYSYNLPGQIVNALSTLHTLREKVAGYGENFETWLRKSISERATIVTNFAAAQRELAISENEVRVQGYFEGLHDIQQASKESDTGRWVSTITYVFTYQQPNEVVMQYPLMVHQQLVPSALRPREPISTFQYAFKQWKQTDLSFEQFGAQNKILLNKSADGLVMPPYDTFLPRSNPMTSVRAFMGLSSISASDKKYLFDLNDLGDFKFHSDVLQFIKDFEYPFMCVPFGSLLQIHYYSGPRIKEQTDLELHSDLKLYFKQDGDLRQVYRVRIGLICDFELVHPNALIRLKNNQAAAIRIAKAINAGIRSLANVGEIGKNRLSPEELAMINLGYNDNWQIVPRDQATIKPKGRPLIEMALIETLYVVSESLTQPEQ